ncbi:capsule biosynthesis GfcC family protein [Pseudidiomarina sp. 1APP75-27a]|uniref:capsule biosynthesis GfcC D2 domain-containing protein n=1 Tax=Pseudidiomarina terrestris TaxID=2820060 RepID=UPI002B05F4E5|nr:capsule biosynthesis GfcC D2 domain-containing protein [Pseudidiomarina sp. 1APP75-27a]MEA3587722.1 capsule biosynthesis GfcC family protein [Pseudidiomarina sp. 1APP75-27a]
MSKPSFRGFLTTALLASFTVFAANTIGVGTVYAQSEAKPVTQVVIGDSVVGFEEQPRLLNLYQAAELRPSAYWPSSRLISVAQTEKIAERRRYVLEKLREVSLSARVEGDESLARAAQAYMEQIPNWPLLGAEWVGVTKIDDSLEVQSGVNVERKSLFSSFTDAVANLQANPLLPRGDMRLLPPQDLGAWQVTVVSPKGIQKLPFAQHETVREVLDKAGILADHSGLAEVTLVSLTGLSRTTPVAYFNDAKAMPPVHGIIFVGLDLSALDDDWQLVNAQLSALLSYWNPQS